MGTISTILWMRKLRRRNRWGFPEVTRLVHEVVEFRTQDSRVVGKGRGDKKGLRTSAQEKGPLGDLSAAVDRLIHYFREKGYLLKLLMCMGMRSIIEYKINICLCVLVPCTQLLKPLASPEY